MRKIKKKSNKGFSGVSLSFRMNVLFISIFILFSLLILRLGYLQIVKGEEYVREVQRQEEVTVNTSAPRGRIYDRYGRILVDNEPQNAITYTRMPKTSQDEMLEIAKKLAKLIDMPTDRITIRDKQDFWILNHKEEAYSKVSKAEEKRIFEKYDDEKAAQAEIDKLVRERISDQELAELSDFDLEVLAIYREMTSGYFLSPQIIKSENVTDEEFARVSERLYELPGVNTTTDWKRVKLTPLAILGRTTVPSKGIPESKLNYYLARDYARNDRVGESYFEAQYEELLQGRKSVVKNVTNKKGEVIDTITTFAGEPGKDLVTTIDIELQKAAEEIVEKYLRELKTYGGSSLLDRAFFIMMNPNTGEILAMVGKKIEKDPETGKQYIADFSYGAFTTSYEVGSTVKAATLLMAYKEGVIEPGTVLIDQPIKLAGTNPKSSIFNRGGAIRMNDLAALERSSNSYMFQVALKLNGTSYRYNMGLRLKEDTLQRMRNGYAEFGLGVPTGIDLPNEVAGYKGILDRPGKILDLAIGQFDTYTPLQLAQYISTIANGGYRVQPRLLKEIHEPSADGKTLGPLVEEIQPKILNRISNSEKEINHVKQGLRRVYIGSQGTARAYFANAPYTAAGKTGTAETHYTGPIKERIGTYTINVAHVGFAPFDHPEVAYAVVIPWATTGDRYINQNSKIAREILDKYFELKYKYASSNISDQAVNKQILLPTSEEKIDENTKEQTVNE
ncbi:penicillin-binding protein 2 [Ureibacillus sp. FSL K6-8385]|uniref:Penicillin-binding protein 2 n=1 Tax=Ureibacillus terrenus TaxID=118246 RepID=A0A540V6D2_9BACL|nr:penicillin-binding protein 2 [Ureibacillus terrenus]MED3660721.1 penicillin-binding protein 2 [Ureibacillus terrenus]MED3762907.1 penicillin-binding protein 2 [Ureibacillus terrenus]TQE92292.1 penicillin-binding protein 2 [Ureibacillus terrenus]